MVFLSASALEFMLGVSRELYPREFMGLLRGEGEYVREVLVLPASQYGEGFAQVRWAQVPIDKTIIGSVHSHPTANNQPSKTDLRSFSKTGRLHLIIKHPYESIHDIGCYLWDGTPLTVKTSEE